MPGFIGLPEMLLLGLVVLADLRPEAAARDGPLARPRDCASSRSRSPATRATPAEPTDASVAIADGRVTARARGRLMRLPRAPRRTGRRRSSSIISTSSAPASSCRAIAVGAAFVGTYVVHARLVRMAGVRRFLPAKKLVTFGVAEPFMTSLQSLARRSARTGAADRALADLELPRTRASIRTSSARRVVRRVATALFAGGLAFGYRVALPAALRFLTTYDSSIYNIQIRAREYISFSLAVLVAVGVVFELPARDRRARAARDPQLSEAPQQPANRLRRSWP